MSQGPVRGIPAVLDPPERPELPAHVHTQMADVRSMTLNVVVGYDATPAGDYAFARAQQLGMPIVLLHSGQAPEIATSSPDGAVDMELRQVSSVRAERVFEEAAQEGSACVVLSDYAHGAVPLLREGMLAARRICSRSDGPLFSLLVAKYRPDRTPTPYKSTLVGVDSTVGSAIASLMATKVVTETGAHLQITTVERRRDSLQREVVDRLASHDGFDPTDVRQRRRTSPTDLTYTRRVIREKGVDADFDYRLGDPSAVLVRATRYGEFDLLVSGIIGVHMHGRQGHIGKVTRKIMRLSPVDHLIVFDRVSLGLCDHTTTPTLCEASVRLLFGHDVSPATEEVAATDGDGRAGDSGGE